MKSGAGLPEYLKRAFLYRWNLLLFLEWISPWPDANRSADPRRRGRVFGRTYFACQIP